MRGPARHLSLTRYVSDGTIDLGYEPPLSLDDGPDKTPVRRAVSWRWLGGTVLTGFTSIVLMGGALMAALDGPEQFATVPDTMIASSMMENSFGQKGDRMRPIEEEIASRQILQVSTVTRQGERDFIKLRPFARITATLSSSNEELAEQVPPYDVMRIFADTTAVGPGGGPVPATADGQISDTNVDGEVSVRLSTLSLDQLSMASVSLDTDAVEQVVRSAARFGGNGDINLAAAMAYAADDNAFGDDGTVIDGGANAEGSPPYSALGVSIVPENVSNVSKTELALGDGTVQEKIVSVGDDSDLRTVLLENEMPDEDADEVVAALAQIMDIDAIGAGRNIRIAYAQDPLDNATERPLRVSLYNGAVHEATVARADELGFIRADEPSSALGAVAAIQQEEPRGTMPRIYDAVYQTALQQEVPSPLIDSLIRIFAFDVDFQARSTPGDTLEVFHSLPDPDDRDAAEPEVLYASLTLNGVKKRFYRFRTSDDGYVDYYDEDGRSAKKFLMRKPVPGARITSNFGHRRHPILGRSLLHTGVDYGGLGYGRPILAAGNGVVEKAGRTSGYGNLIVLRHTNGYETYYAHQQNFAKGIAPGVRVRQGQVIGYVGSTGQSTGPHLHFEIRINGKPVDPLRIRLPEGRVLEADLLRSFENERNRIDTLLGNQPVQTTLASTQ